MGEDALWNANSVNAASVVEHGGKVGRCVRWVNSVVWRGLDWFGLVWRVAALLHSLCVMGLTPTGRVPGGRGKAVQVSVGNGLSTICKIDFPCP